MAAAAFKGDSNGLRLSDGEAKMAIDTSGGGWQRRASAVDGGNGRRFAMMFDGNGRQLWRRWMIEMAFNGGGGGGV